LPDLSADRCWAAVLVDPTPRVRAAVRKAGLPSAEAGGDDDVDMLIDRLIDGHMPASDLAPAG